MSDFAYNRLASALGFGDTVQSPLAGSQLGVAHAVCGMARVVSSDAELAGLIEGEILVARCCPPEWRAQLALVRAVVLESDAHAPHLIRASHDLDVPVVTGVCGLLARVRTGAIVACDSDGVLELLDERRHPDSPMRFAPPAARQSRLRLAEGPGPFAAAASLSVVDGAAAAKEARDGE